MPLTTAPRPSVPPIGQLGSLCRPALRSSPPSIHQHDCNLDRGRRPPRCAPGFLRFTVTCKIACVLPLLTGVNRPKRLATGAEALKNGLNPVLTLSVAMRLAARNVSHSALPPPSALGSTTAHLPVCGSRWLRGRAG